MSRDLKKYAGVIPAFYACYDDDGEISPERITAFTQYLIEKKVNGLYVGGSSGECVYQTIEERKRVLEAVMSVAKGKIPVIAHVGAPSTRHSVELAVHAEQCGVDAIASIPPIYFVLSEESIYQYWSAMINATDCDFIIYNIPGTTQYALSMDLFKKMIKHKNVVGVKNSSLPTMDIQRFKAAAGNNFVIFNGPDEQFISGRVMGASAGIGGTYAVMPELFLAADKAVRENNMDEALKIQNAINDIIFTALGAKGNMYSVFKAVLKEKGVNIGKARLPLAPITPEDASIVASVGAKIDSAIADFVL